MRKPLFDQIWNEIQELDTESYVNGYTDHDLVIRRIKICKSYGISYPEFCVQVKRSVLSKSELKQYAKMVNESMAKYQQMME